MRSQLYDLEEEDLICKFEECFNFMDAGMASGKLLQLLLHLRTCFQHHSVSRTRILAPGFQNEGCIGSGPTGSLVLP